MSAVWHPFTQHGLGEPIVPVERAQGAYLYTSDGASVLDAISSWWVTTHGHCHPAIMAAIAAQAQKLDQLIFAGWTHQPAETLATALAAKFGLPRVFFSDSGSTCVEVALKMALGYWHNRGEPRGRIVVMEHSYHGDTIGTMSVGARGVYNAAYAPLLFDVGSVPFPHAGAEQATYDALEAECRAGAAAFIVEPLLLGAGGMLVYGPQVLAEMARICAAHGVLFIADEVMTGWGRTGTLWACQQAGVVPDILCLAKGITGGAMPLAVTLASEAIFAAHYSTDRARTFYHSSSYTANPIACAAACANLQVWAQEPVSERIAALVAAHAAAAPALARVPGVADVRQCGTMLAVDYEVGTGAGYLSALQPRLLAFFRQAGMLVRPLGNTAYLLPPYCLTAADHARLIDALATAAQLAIADYPA
jgi:adenosylmethionine-8-amino-7-oxononanoate aminotransferase